MAEVKPVFLESQYVNDVALWTVREDGYLSSDFIDVPELSIETVKTLEVNFENLAWVAFYKRALIKIKHQKPNEVKSEVLEGKRQKWAANQFVVDLADGKPVFGTEASILESGILSPHMKTWLNRLADNHQSGSSVEWAFEDLLGRSLR